MTITLIDRVPDGDSVRLTFELVDETMLPYLVPKGYVALNGVSLTLTFVDDEQHKLLRLSSFDEALLLFPD